MVDSDFSIAYLSCVQPTYMTGKIVCQSSVDVIIKNLFDNVHLRNAITY